MSEDGGVPDFLRANFARLKERLDRVDTRLDEMTSRIATLERDVAALSSRVAEIKVDFATINKGRFRYYTDATRHNGSPDQPDRAALGAG